MNCSSCGDILEEDVGGDPYTYGPDDDLCSDCYHEQYEFTCCGCGEYGHIDDQHKFCVVFGKEAGIAPGIYRITSYPYYVDEILSAWLLPHSLELLVCLPFQWFAYTSITGKKVYHKLIEHGNPDGYLAAGLCAKCQEALLKQVRKCE